MHKNSETTAAINQPIVKKVFFAHQSVGYNIISGIQRIASSAQITDVSGKPIPETIMSAIYHCKIGRNTDPRSKIDEFKNLLIASRLGEKFDVAALKLCYVDIDRSTDIAGLLGLYSAAVDEIKKKYPKLILVHCTVPLTTHNPPRLKTKIKYFLYGDVNVRRNEYNDLLRRKYNGNGPVLDIAALEAAKPDGTRETFSFKGKTCEALFPGYSSDGGHLNSAGQDWVAERFLKLLADLQ